MTSFDILLLNTKIREVCMYVGWGSNKGLDIV